MVPNDHILSLIVLGELAVKVERAQRALSDFRKPFRNLRQDHPVMRDLEDAIRHASNAQREAVRAHVERWPEE